MKLIDSLNRIGKMFSIGRKMNDSIPIGFLGGLVGTIAMDLSNLIFKKTGLSRKTYSQYAGSIIMRPFRLFFKENRILGQLLHLITGAIAGIPLFGIMKMTGKDNYLLKGAVYGTFTWELLYAFGLRFGVLRIKPHSTRSHFTALIDNLVYGFASTGTMNFLAERWVFPQGKENQLESALERDISASDVLMEESMYDNLSEGQIH